MRPTLRFTWAWVQRARGGDQESFYKQFLASGFKGVCEAMDASLDDFECYGIFEMMFGSQWARQARAKKWAFK